MDAIVLDNYKIILDTNVLLHIYGYSPEFSEFAIDCLNAGKDNLVLPSTVAIEYGRHRKKEFAGMKNRISSVEERSCRQIENTEKIIHSVCAELEKMQYPDVEDLKNMALSKSSELQRIFKDFFSDRKSALELLAASWGENDHVLNLYHEISAAGNIMRSITQEELYLQCEEGEKRYRNQTPPGYKDADKKGNGLRKYGDYLLWWEILRYAKENAVDIIFVTDDVKTDWCEVNNGEKQLRPELIKEFEKKTSRKIISMDSKEYFQRISEKFGIAQSDTVAYALKLTDEDYCEKIADLVFDKIAEKLMYNGIDYIDEDSANIGDMGFTGELEVEEYSFVSGEQTARDDDQIYYSLKFEVVLSGYSTDYMGRDDDTKEVIPSPASYHEFEGEIEVAITRTADRFIDFADDMDFDDAEIIEGNLTETVFEPYSEEPYEVVYKNAENRAGAESISLYQKRQAACEQLQTALGLYRLELDGNDPDAAIGIRKELDSMLWELILLFEGFVFQTSRGLEFSYTVKGGEVFISRRENSKSLTKSSILMAFYAGVKLQSTDGYVKGPKKLGTFGASYLYPMFLQFGVITKEAPSVK